MLSGNQNQVQPKHIQNQIVLLVYDTSITLVFKTVF